MRSRLSDYQEMYGDLYIWRRLRLSLPATVWPKHDKKRYPDIITAGGEGDTPYYTNSSHLPVGYTEDILRRWIFRMIFRLFTPPERCSTLSLERRCRIGRRQQAWFGPLRRTTSFLIILCRRPIRSVRPTAIWQGSISSVRRCGAKAEVYSRITGYYRPVQNWNEGKLQEYKNRTTYNVGASRLTHGLSRIQAVSEARAQAQAERQVQTERQAQAEPAAKESAKEQQAFGANTPVSLYLFTTKTCPNCRTAMGFLKGMDYQVVDAEEHPELAEKYGIFQAPTLVAVADGIMQKFSGASNIRKFAEQNREAAYERQ